MAPKSRTSHQHKRHGKHQKQTKTFMKVYWPYMPLLIIVVLGMAFTSYWQPRSHRGVLAYATSMSNGGLLSSTNQQRAANGVGSLSINSQLSQAAQAKANDMVARDYWSHNTPDGNPPWVFISNAGYSYTKAGENLAYGFTSSDDTVTGWMNSPSHRENLLDGKFVDVGFGFANSANFVGSGPETIVVAEYGAPQAAPAPAAPVVATKAPTTTLPAAKPQTQGAESTAPTAQTTPTPAPVTTLPANETPKAEDKKVEQAVTTLNTSNKEPPPKTISRLGVLTHGSLPWITSATSLLVVVGLLALAVRHGFALRKWMVRGEKYVLHHAVFDVTVVSLVGLCLIVSQSAGVIR